MAREIEFDVNTEYRGRGLLDAADDMDRYARRVENADHKMRGMAQESSHVEANIRKLRQSVVDIGAEIDRTGDKTLFSKLNKDRSQLKMFERIAKEAEQAGQAAGDAMSKGILSSLGDLGGNLRGAVIPVGIGLGVLLSPVIGGAVAGAVVGGVGLGGIAGGIAAAASDPKVRQAASTFGATISSEFHLAGKPFVEPVIESLNILAKDAKAIHLDETFAKAAPYVTALARGVGGLVTEAMPGLNRALDHAGPALLLLGQELPEVGAAFGDMVGDIASSKGAIDGLHFVLEEVEGTLRVTGTVVAWLGDRFHDIAGAGAAFTGAMEDITAKAAYISPPLALVSNKFADMNNKLEEITGTAPKLDGAFAPIPGRVQSTSGAVQELTTSTSRLGMSIDELRTKLDGLFDDQMGVDQALLATQTDTLALKKAVDEHGHSLSTNTDAGLSNRRMILGLIGDYEQQRDAAIKAGTSTGAATRKFDDQVDALYALGTKLGFSKSELDKLLGAYKKLHDAPDIHKEITVTYHVVGSGALNNAISKTTMLKGYDVGGMVPGRKGEPQLAVVHGGEWIARTDQVDEANRRGALSSPWSAGAGAGGGGIVGYLVVRHEYPDASQNREELLALKKTLGLDSLGF